MVIEVLGSRVIGPFFGVSLFVWTSLISVALLSLAGVDPAMLSEADGNVQAGRSRAAVFSGAVAGRDQGGQGFGLEIFGGRAYRDGPWKITWMHAPFGTDDWQLFNLADDPAELHDLSAIHPDIKARLLSAFDDYARANNVTIPDRTIFDGLEDNLPPRPPVDSPDWPRGQEKNWTATDEEDDDDDN